MDNSVGGALRKKRGARLASLVMPRGFLGFSSVAFGAPGRQEPLRLKRQVVEPFIGRQSTKVSAVRNFWCHPKNSSRPKDSPDVILSH